MINFITEEVEMPDFPQEKFRKWIVKVAEDHGKSIGSLTYCFCNDSYILKANNEFLGHDYYTDIITFDNTRGNCISGDMLISLETVRSNAELIAEEYDNELRRVVIHGVLHLCGIDDKGPGEREIMEAEEDRALELYRGL